MFQSAMMPHLHETDASGRGNNAVVSGWLETARETHLPHVLSWLGASHAPAVGLSIAGSTL